MRTNIIGGFLLLLILVTSCNRRYSTRQYIKHEKSEVAVSITPRDEDKIKLAAEINGETALAIQEDELQEVDILNNDQEHSVLSTERANSQWAPALNKKIHWPFSGVYKNKQNLHPESALPDEEPATANSKKGLAVASLVLGILSLVMLLVVPLFSVVLAILAVIFGGIAMKDKNARGMAIAGLVTGLVTLMIFFFIFLLVLAMFL